MKTMMLKIRGTRQILLHADTACDPLSDAAIEMSKRTKRKDKKTADAQEDIARGEWFAGIYADGDGVYMPTWNVLRCIQDGARMSKQGKLIERAVTAVEDRAHFVGVPRDLEKLWADRRYRDRRSVKVGTARVIRTRPAIPSGWRLDIALAFEESMIDEQAIRGFAETAGAMIGLGDFRQRFGRFELV